MDQKTVFISYRRDMSRHLARSIYQDLKMHGWDAFLDVNTIDSGDFDRIILNQIGARAHFLLLISQDSLRRCVSPGDWVLREIEEAVRLERNIVPVIEEGVNFNQEMSYLPDELREVVSKKNALPLSHFYFDAGVEMLRNRFLKTPEYIRIQETSADEQAQVQRLMAQYQDLMDATEAAVKAPLVSPSLSLMPAPFGWIAIPGKGYSIARYPITNDQFAQFIKAGGYDERNWWTEAGWQARSAGVRDHNQQAKGKPQAWTQPLNWDEPQWNHKDQPVVGVSWYEAMAFCQWLTYRSGESIMLPTRAQWVYAAQGDDQRAYPWGDEWDCTRCNNSVKPCDSNVSTPVTQYAGLGDSPFGVVDMAGNVWEWCLDATNDGDSRILCGGSWDDLDEDAYRCDYHDSASASSAQMMWGFRIVRL